MQPGQKMHDADGNQVCLFPLSRMDVTQWNGVGTYSHCCGHMADYGTNGVVTPVYAPCDMHMVYNKHTAAHTLMYCSDTKVRTPSGLQWVSIQLTHANNPPYVQNVKQGDIMYYSGTAGGVALHLHLDQSFVKNADWVNSHIQCDFGIDCYYLNGTIDPQYVFFINDTAIVDDHGEDWKYFHDDTPTPPDPPVPPDPVSGGRWKWYLWRKMLLKRRNE